MASPPSPLSIMPAHFPVGRCGTDEFCRLAGLSRTIFFTNYRHDRHYIERFDIRVDALGRLNMSERAGRRFGETRAGKRVHGNTGRFPTRPCPHCGDPVHPRAKTCPLCHQPISRRYSGDESTGAA